MATPRSPLSLRFYRAAYQRMEEARILRANRCYTGSIYLAGYAVECMLKTLILESVPASKQSKVLIEFRGQRAHSFEWLRHRYLQLGAPPLAAEVHASLLLVSTWETDLRYEPSFGNEDTATRFLAAVRDIMNWANGRI